MSLLYVYKMHEVKCLCLRQGVVIKTVVARNPIRVKVTIREWKHSSFFVWISSLEALKALGCKPLEFETIEPIRKLLAFTKAGENWLAGLCGCLYQLYFLLCMSINTLLFKLGSIPMCTIPAFCTDFAFKFLSGNVCHSHIFLWKSDNLFVDRSCIITQRQWIPSESMNY